MSIAIAAFFEVVIYLLHDLMPSVYLPVPSREEEEEETSHSSRCVGSNSKHEQQQEYKGENNLQTKMQQKQQQYGDRRRPSPFRAAAAMMVGGQAPFAWTNTRNRACYFNKSMSSLQEFWHPTNPYPLLLQRETPWLEEEMTEIRRSWPRLGSMIEFLDISKPFLEPRLPHNMAPEDNNNADIGYKRMCIYKSYGFLKTPQINRLDYVMMLDDDTCFLEPLTLDVFDLMYRHPQVAYAFTSFMAEAPMFVIGLNEFVQDFVAQEKINNNTITMANPKIIPLTSRRQVTKTKHMDIRKKREQGRQRVWAGNKNLTFNLRLAPRVFATNLEWIHVPQYRDSPLIAKFLFDHVDKSQMILHRRWGDAPLRTVLAYLIGIEPKLCTCAVSRTNIPT